LAKPSLITAVNNAKTASFAYIPPAVAFNAPRIIVKPNLGYPKKPPVVISMRVLEGVLRGLRRVNPSARILIIEGACSKVAMMDLFKRSGIDDLLDDGMQVADAEELPLRDYPNLLPEPIKYKTMRAPAVLGDYECLISVGAFKRTTLKGEPLISASLKNLYGLFPRDFYHGRSPNARGQLHQPSVPEILKDVYFTIGHLFDGAVVDLDQKFVSPDHKPDRGEAVPVGQVVWGDDLLAVDEAACRLGGEQVASYLTPIRDLRDTLVAN